MGRKVTHAMYSVAGIVAAVLGAGAGCKWSDASLKSDVFAVEDAVARLKAL